MIPTDAELRRILERLEARAGLTFPPSRHREVRAAALESARSSGLSHLDPLLDELDRQGAAFDDLVARVTIGETHFFREPAQFAFLEREVLPELRRRRGEDHVLRIWSAGCGTGEEAYSLALTASASWGERVWVLGTDISRPALDRARRGAYRAWSFRGEGARALASLERREDEVVVPERLRRLVHFEHLNLAADGPAAATRPGGFDLIFCRNVLIYLAGDAIARVAGRLFAALERDGWLFTASTDPLLSPFAPFELVTSPEVTCYRHPQAQGRVVVPLRPVLARPEPALLRELPRAPAWPRAPLPAPPAPPAVRAREGRSAGVDLLTRARAALDRGDYQASATLAAEAPGDPAACALHVRALALLGDQGAARAAAAAHTARHPTSAALHYLNAVVLLGAGRLDEARAALRRVLYLDPGLAVAEALGAVVHERAGDLAAARRAYARAHLLSFELPPDAPVPLGEGETAQLFRQALARQMHRLDLLLAGGVGVEVG